jgi:hypothetical protein
VFTRTYSDSPLCSPTRSALPTGVQGKPQSVPFELASRHWQELSIDVPATGPLGIVRVDLPQQVEPIQIDWMEIHSADSGKLTLAEF